MPAYRGTASIRKRPPAQDPPRILGIGLRSGPTGGAFSHGRGTPVAHFVVSTRDSRRERDLELQRHLAYKKPPPRKNFGMTMPRLLGGF